MLIECISKKRRLDNEDLNFIIEKTDNKKDYMFLNFLEQEIISQYGKNFLIESSDKIQCIIGFVLDNDYQSLYDMYNGSFDNYMGFCNNDDNCICGFNITFIVLIHMSMKILRRNKNLMEETL